MVQPGLPCGVPLVVVADVEYGGLLLGDEQLAVTQLVVLGILVERQGRLGVVVGETYLLDYAIDVVTLYVSRGLLQAVDVGVELGV